MTSFGIWLLFAAITLPTLFSDQYIIGLIGSVMLGCVVGLIFGAWQDARKEDTRADAKEDADQSPV